MLDLHFLNNPALTVAQRDAVIGIVDEADKVQDYSPEIADKVIEKVFIREQARAVAQAAIEVINGQKDDLANLHRVLADVQSLSTSSALVPVTDELEEIINGSEAIVKWKFNIKELEARAKGGGPGLFAVIAARPEVGKTAAWVSLSAGPDGFCDQGAIVHAICNEEPAIRTKGRAVSACTGFHLQQVKANLKKASTAWGTIKGKFEVYDAVGITFEQIEAHLQLYKPDILVIDQLDKVKVDGDFNRGDEKLREIYTRARELAKAHSCFVIGISQISADGEDKANVDASMLEGSKTGKYAEADIIICIGYSRAIHGEQFRQWNLSKNKITGDHGFITTRLDNNLSRYTE